MFWYLYCTMEIKYLGHASFLIKNKEGKLVMDPFDPKVVGLKFPKQEADVVTVSHSHPDHSLSSQIEGNPLVLDWPGQFEKKGIRIWGYGSFHDKKEGAERGENVLYKVETEGVSLLHCGDLGVIPTDEFIDEIGEVHVLMVPVGGKFSLDSTEAMALIKKVDPMIVIPMHYGRSELLIEGLAPLGDFLKKMGAENTEPVDKLVLKKEDFIADQPVRVVILKS